MKPYNDVSDSELVQLIKCDDQKALSELFNRYWDKLFIVATHRLNNPEIAEECVQDVFVSLWQRRKDLELKYSVATYFAVAIKYRVINQMDMQYRAKNKLERAAQAAEPGFIPSADQLLLEKELLSQIEEAVEKLPEKCRIVFKKSREEGKTNKQIAAELEVSEKMVEAHLTKAIKTLRGGLTALPPALVILLLVG